MDCAARQRGTRAGCFHPSGRPANASALAGASVSAGWGGRAIQITSGPADEHEPSFSPDGSRIVYRSEQDGGGVYIVSALGGEPTLLAPGGRGPRFSPDGSWVAFWVGHFISSALGAGAGQPSVFVVPASGGAPRALRSCRSGLPNRRQTGGSCRLTVEQPCPAGPSDTSKSKVSPRRPWSRFHVPDIGPRTAYCFLRGSATASIYGESRSPNAICESTRLPNA